MITSKQAKKLHRAAQKDPAAPRQSFRQFVRVDHAAWLGGAVSPKLAKIRTKKAV